MRRAPRAVVTATTMPYPEHGTTAPGATPHRAMLRGAIWLIVYLFFVLAPLFALLAGAQPEARSFWTEFSVAIGYAGLAMMGLQFGLTARFTRTLSSLTAERTSFRISSISRFVSAAVAPT